MRGPVGGTARRERLPSRARSGCQAPGSSGALGHEHRSRRPIGLLVRLWQRISRAANGCVPVGGPGDRLRRVGDAAGWGEAPIHQHRSGSLPAVSGLAALDLLPAGLDRHLGGCFLKLPLEFRKLLLDLSRFAGRLQLPDRIQHLTEPQNVVCAHWHSVPSVSTGRPARASTGLVAFRDLNRCSQVYISHGAAGQLGRSRRRRAPPALGPATRRGPFGGLLRSARPTR